MEPDSLSCQHCGERFQRREHRDRHLLRHTGHKPFQCNICFKSFPRQDTLVRHQALHNSSSGSSQSRGRRPRGRACLPCSRLKQGCSGGYPCSRCKNRDTTCIYNPARSSDIPSGDIAQDGTPLSPVTRNEDLVSQDNLSCDIYTAPNEWNDPPSNTPGISAIPDVYAAIPNTTTNWQTTDFLSSGNFGGLGPTLNIPWMPWNAFMDNSYFPWFTGGSEVSLDFSNLPETVDPIVVVNASSPAPNPSVGSALAIPPATASRETTHSHTYIRSENICSSYTKPCLPFPKPQDIGFQMAGAELFGHIHSIPEQAVEGLNTFYKTQRPEEAIEVIPREFLHAFVELYFEYFDLQFPFLHPSRFEDPDLQWILLLATAAIGSHYSEIQGAEEYNLALSDLLARAVEQTLSNQITNVDIAIVQSVFLLHVLWMFSHSHRDKIVLQHKQSSLSTLCWDLLSRANKRSNSSKTASDTDITWQEWLTTESEIRLVTCVRVLECLGHIFLFMPLTINLRDATRQLPCDERRWKCRTALDWKSRLETSEDSRPATTSQNHSDRPSSKAPFSCKVALLELYLDERDIARQLLTSKLLRSSFTSYLGSEASNGAQDTSHRLEVRNENHLLDAIIDQLTFTNTGTAGDTIFHFIAILRLIPIPLETLHFATGWQANKEQMLESKMHLRDFFRNNGSKARKGLWHAVRIFKTTRDSRRLMCYDALSLVSAMGYIYCYSEARFGLSQDFPTSSTSNRPSIIRLDQLHQRSELERWIDDDSESLVHLTGVGLLDGSDHCVRLLRDLEKTMSSQIAWRGFCRIFATCYSQLRRGEMPDSQNYNRGQSVTTADAKDRSGSCR